MPLLQPLQWPSLVILISALSVGPVGILAQSSPAVCLADFNWMVNSKNQNPCVVAAYLQGACNGGQFTVPALPHNTHYTGPYADQQNQCQCSSVTYNVVSACGLCQNHTIISWSTWDYNCSTVYPAIFPAGVPDGTAVPQWAFQDVTTSNMFNVTLAQDVGDNPESTASHPQSTGSAVSTSVPSSPTPTPSAQTSHSSSTKRGAIAGGVVGGVVGLALIVAAVVYFVLKKKRSQIPSSAQFAGDHSSRSTMYTGSSPFTFAHPMSQPKLYDPSDPSTYPTSSPPRTFLTASSHEVPNSVHSTTSLRPGAYSGAPEI